MASVDGDLPDEDAAARLASRLAGFAEGLSGRDRDVMANLLFRAMDPVDQMAVRQDVARLAAEEEALVRDLEARSRDDPAR